MDDNSDSDISTGDSDIENVDVEYEDNDEDNENTCASEEITSDEVPIIEEEPSTNISINYKKPNKNEIYGIYIKLVELLNNNLYTGINSDKLYDIYNIKLYDNWEIMNTSTIAIICMILNCSNICVKKSTNIIKRYGGIKKNFNFILYYNLIKNLIINLDNTINTDILRQIFPTYMSNNIVTYDIIDELIDVKKKLT